MLRELREKEEDIHKTVDITLDVIRRGTANQTTKASIDSSPIGQIVHKAMGVEGKKQIELHNQSLPKKKVVRLTQNRCRVDL